MTTVRYHSQAGSGVIEVLIATLVVGLTMTSVAAVMTLSLQSTSQNRLRAIASTRGQEAIETFRRYRDELGWQAFSSQFSAPAAQTYCLDPLPSNALEFSQLAPQNCDSGVAIVGTEFTREVEVTTVGTPVTSVQIRPVVRWQDGEQTKQVVLFQELTNY